MSEPTPSVDAAAAALYRWTVQCTRKNWPPWEEVLPEGKQWYLDAAKVAVDALKAQGWRAES